MLCGWNDGDAREFVAAHGDAGASMPARRADSVQVCMFRWLTGITGMECDCRSPFARNCSRPPRPPNAADFEQVSATVATNRLFLGDWGDALAQLSVEMESARKNDNLRLMFWLSILRAWVHLHAMDFEGVIEICLPFAPLLRALEGQGTSELPASVSPAQLHMALICRGSASRHWVTPHRRSTTSRAQAGIWIATTFFSIGTGVCSSTLR